MAWWTISLLLLLLAHAGAAHQQLLQDRTRTSSSGYTLEAEADRVEFLPGGPAQLDFGLFSGYITVDEAAGRALFYVFAEARTPDPTTAPVLLWLNGGPGCSSLGGGFLSELGPFYPTAIGSSLQPNPYSWNNLTNVIWLESPAFVGFSYSNSSADQLVGDGRTAADARLFLLHWMKRFPQYAQSDLYLSGESYGGHYVPNLALEIVKGNKKAPTAAAAAAGGVVAETGSSSSVRRSGSSVSSSSSSDSGDGVGVSPGKGYLNLKGFFVGNAWTDAAIDNRGALDFWYSHAMVSAEARSAITDNCDFSSIGPLLRGAEALSLPGTHSSNSKHSSSSSSRRGVSSGLGHGGVPSWGGYGSSITTRFWESLGLSGFSHRDDKELVCARWLDIAQAELGNINIYEIYADVCVQPPPSANSGSSSSGSVSSSSRSYRGALLGHLHPRKRIAGGIGEDGDAGQDDAAGHLPRKPRYDPCIDGEVETYFNLPAVQEALHANQTVKLPWRWTDCTQQISYSREDLLSSMLPVYKQLLDASPALKIWVFSGDVDGIVPVLGSRRWIESLQLPVAKPWRAWTSRTGQVGGWRIDYEGLTFATVRNSGHMVPYVTPERAFHLLTQFFKAGTTTQQAQDGVGATAGSHHDDDTHSSSSSKKRDAAGLMSLMI